MIIHISFNFSYEKLIVFYYWLRIESQFYNSIVYSPSLLSEVGLQLKESLFTTIPLNLQNFESWLQNKESLPLNE